MNTRIIVAIFLAAFKLSGCNAQKEPRPVMILFSYEGMPRAHLPVVAWFAGNTIPLFAKSADHDGFWLQRLADVPKFALTAEAFTLAESMFNKSSETPSVYMIEFLFESERSKIRYIDLKEFERVRSTFREAQIKGHELLADWPTAESGQ